MKTLKILFVILTIGSISGIAQSDSLRYSQENGTLEKQRFIDQYDYVFMTKEPTKWMVKAGFNPPESPLYGLALGFEKKASPSLSFGAGVYSGHEPSSNLGYWLECKVYYEMAKRIQKGKANNNFSGNYISLITIQNLRTQFASTFYNLYESNNPTAYINDDFKSFYGVRWGMQRRFFNHGFIDLSINAGGQYYKTPYWYSEGEFLIQTDARFGFALCDFKKSVNAPLCDVLMCYEKRAKMFKVAWPSIQLGTKRQKVSASAAYEFQLGNNSPFSVNFQSSFTYSHINDGIWEMRKDSSSKYESVEVHHYYTSLANAIQLRRYLHFSKQQLNNLSGAYFGISLSNDLKFITYFFYNTKYSKTAFSPMIGFQQKIFSNGYLDFNASYNIVLSEKVTGYHYTETNNFKTQLGFGFAF